MKLLLAILIFLHIGITLLAQDNKTTLRNRFTEAEYFFLDEEYSAALSIYKELFEQDTSNCNLAFRIGECYYQEKFFFKAIDYLKIAEKHMSKRYNEGSCKETESSYKVLFLLAKSNQIIREFDEASKYYTYFINILDVKNVYDYDIAISQLEACQRAKEMVLDPVFVEIENLGFPVNTSENELNVTVSGNDSLMIFARKAFRETKFREDTFFVQNYEIYSSIKKSNIGGDVKKIDRELSSDGFFIPVSLSEDGKTLILFRDNYANGDFDDEDALYYSIFKDSTWSKVRKFGGTINSNKWESAGFISNDGNTLYFLAIGKAERVLSICM